MPNNFEHIQPLDQESMMVSEGPRSLNPFRKIQGSYLAREQNQTFQSKRFQPQTSINNLFFSENGRLDFYEQENTMPNNFEHIYPFEQESISQGPRSFNPFSDFKEPYLRRSKQNIFGSISPFKPQNELTKILSQPQTAKNEMIPKLQTQFNEIDIKKIYMGSSNLNKPRRKKVSGQSLKSAITTNKNQQKDETNQSDSRKNRNRIGEQYTKNLLKAGKTSLCNFILNSQKGKYIVSMNPEFRNWMKKKTFNMIEFDFLYKNECIEPVLSQYFKSRILYRDLMNSRVMEKNKKKYMYFLDIFEENFRIKEFKGISDTKLKIEKKIKKRKRMSSILLLKQINP